MTTAQYRAELEQRGRILMIAAERSQARDLGLEQAAKLVENIKTNGDPIADCWLETLARMIRGLKAVP